MLILTRKIGESIVVGNDTYITIMGIKGNQIRLGIDAPASITVNRKEIHLKIKDEKRLSKNAHSYVNNKMTQRLN